MEQEPQAPGKSSSRADQGFPSDEAPVRVGRFVGSNKSNASRLRVSTDSRWLRGAESARGVSRYFNHLTARRKLLARILAAIFKKNVNGGLQALDAFLLALTLTIRFWKFGTEGNEPLAFSMNVRGHRNCHGVKVILQRAEIQEQRQRGKQSQNTMTTRREPPSPSTGKEFSAANFAQ
jgi:hypothetical protein